MNRGTVGALGLGLVLAIGAYASTTGCGGDEPVVHGASDAGDSGIDTGSPETGSPDGGIDTGIDSALGADADAGDAACTVPDGGVGGGCSDAGDCACGTVCSLGACVPPSGCDQARLAWDGPTTNSDGTCLTDLAGFAIEYGPATGGPYPNIVDAGLPCVPGPTVACGDGGSANQLSCAFLVTNLDAGTWYFVATAYDTTGNMSVPSNEASKTIACP